VASFPLNVDHVVRPEEAIGRIVASQGADNSLLDSFLGTLDLPRGRFLWSGAWDTVGEHTFSGSVYLFELPLVGDHDERDASALYFGDPGDFVQFGLSDDSDLDDDGIRGLVFGAQARLNGMGAVAVLSDPPDGDHRIWDLAVATFEGTEPDGYLGEQVASGDLDGDGHPDLSSGAAAVYGTNTFHAFQGPVGGDRLASDSDWTLHGPDGIERLGVSSAIADLDGDGANDLVVGRPANPALGTVDGSVLVFHGPMPPGTYDPESADFVLTNVHPPGTGDFFGYFLRTGDLDGDGAAKLAIGAPDDRDGGRPVGSVQILFGRADLFDP
jgi:hypothetical protein